MESQRKILNRYRRGEKIRSISREMNLSRYGTPYCAM